MSNPSTLQNRKRKYAHLEGNPTPPKKRLKRLKRMKCKKRMRRMKRMKCKKRVQHTNPDQQWLGPCPSPAPPSLIMRRPSALVSRTLLGKSTVQSVESPLLNVHFYLEGKPSKIMHGALLEWFNHVSRDKGENPLCCHGLFTGHVITTLCLHQTTRQREDVQRGVAWAVGPRRLSEYLRDVVTPIRNAVAHWTVYWYPGELARKIAYKDGMKVIWEMQNKHLRRDSERYVLTSRNFNA